MKNSGKIFGIIVLAMVISSMASCGNKASSGTFTVSGKTLILIGLDQPISFTITNSKTLTESDGSVWKKQ